MGKYGRCPRCGYEGHNTIYHIGTNEIECERCRRDYVQPKKSSQKKGDSFSSFDFSTKEPYACLYPPNDVWMSPSGNVSVGFPTLGSNRIGHKSIDGNSVFDHNGRFAGRVVNIPGHASFLDTRSY